MGGRTADCTQVAWCGLQLQSITGKDPYGRSLNLGDAPGISDMCGVKNLKGALPGAFFVSVMNGLVSLDGAEGITSVGVDTTFGKSIYLVSNPILTSAIALANTEYPAGTLKIGINPILECVPSAWPATDEYPAGNTITHGSCPITPGGGVLLTGGIIGAVAVVALLIACAIKRRRQRGKQQGANAGDGGGQELSAFSAVATVFVSWRMSECKAEVKALQTALEAKDVKVIVIGELPGGDLLQAVTQGMEEADQFIIMGTETYGRQTSGMIDTYKEMQYIVSSKKPFFLFNMNPESSLMRFQEGAANVVFNLNTVAWERWAVGAPMPPKVTEKILHKLELA
jgi:hypothetical protein